MEYESNLILQHLVFDEIEFKRLGFKTYIRQRNFDT